MLPPKTRNIETSDILLPELLPTIELKATETAPDAPQTKLVTKKEPKLVDEPIEDNDDNYSSNEDDDDSASEFFLNSTEEYMQKFQEHKTDIIKASKIIQNIILELTQKLLKTLSMPKTS